MRRIAWALVPTLLVACPVALASTGGILFEQSPAPANLFLTAASQEFPATPEFTIFAADDFDVPGGPGWSVTGLTSFFTTGTGSGLPPQGIRWIIFGDNKGEPGPELLNVVGGTLDLDTGLAQVDLQASASDIDLASGTYWLTSQLIGDLDFFGQEFHLGSLDGAGTSNFMWNNPGDGLGLPTGWFDANGTINPDTSQPYSDVQNLAFRLNGTIIPEPATLILLVLSGLQAMRRRPRGPFQSR